MRELVSLQVFKNTDGFVFSISKIRNNNIRLLNKIHITRAVRVSEQPFSRNLGGGYCWRRFQILGVLSPTYDFSSPANTGLFVDLHICQESLVSYLDVSTINGASCEVLSLPYREKLGKK